MDHHVTLEPELLPSGELTIVLTCTCGGAYEVGVGHTIHHVMRMLGEVEHYTDDLHHRQPPQHEGEPL